MATLEHLRGDGTLVRYDAELEPGEMPQRMIYMAVAFVDWAEDVLFSELADEDQPLSPYEQVEARFYDFVVNRPMVYGVHKKLLRPEIRGVWTLRTDDVRVFGWFPAKGIFVAVRGEMKRNLQKIADYDAHIGRVREYRDTLPLDEPKSIAGTRPDEIA